MNDVQVTNCGSVWQFTPMNEGALSWIGENVQAEGWQWLGDSLVVDWRYGMGLVELMRNAGLLVS